MLGNIVIGVGLAAVVAFGFTGAWLGIMWDNPSWFYMMAPYLIFHEGGFGLAIIALIVAGVGLWLLGWLP